MDSIFTVTEPAADLALLSIEELRAAIGLAAGDDSQDTALTALGLRVAARIAAACGVAVDGVVPPTLRMETLTESFRRGRYGVHPDRLRLARRPIVSVASVEEDGTALDAADYQILAARGALLRLSSDQPSAWCTAKIVVAYDAGWETVPDDLKRAAGRLARIYWSEGSRDTALRRESIEIPGVRTIQREFWIGAATDPDIPGEIMEMLTPYRNVFVG